MTQTLTLQKGQNLSLTKTAPGMKNCLVGLGWEPRTTAGAAFDLDASAFLLNKDGKCRSNGDFVYYGQLFSGDGSVMHTGDNLTGEGDGDDEVLKVDLPAVPADVEKIVFTVTIYDAQTRGQNFGQVGKAFIRCVDPATNTEVCRYDLSEDMSTETGMIFGEIYRHNGEWKFRAVGQGYAGGLQALNHSFGLNIN